MTRKLQPLPTIDAAIPADEIQLPCVLYLAADDCKPLTFQVDSLTVAAQAFIAYRELYNLGASQLAEHCGNIYGADRKTLVAKISFNGRAWSPTGELLAEAPETSTHEYACGCLVPTGEVSRYYDHPCASCHRANWTRKAAL